MRDNNKLAFEFCPELTNEESALLEQCEADIQRGAEVVWNALKTIRDNRLYRQTHKTFEEYCRERWGMSRVHAHRKIQAAAVIENLLPIGNKIGQEDGDHLNNSFNSGRWFGYDYEHDTNSRQNHPEEYPLPTTESQIRPLTKLTPDQQREAWDQVVQENGENITARKVQEVVERITRPHVANNSGNNEWYTPSEYIETARAVLGEIDLDPASSPIANETVKAFRYFTEDDNGLNQDWSGRVWMNPPYAKGLIDEFIYKVVTSYQEGKIFSAIVLVNNATETSWGHHLLGSAKAVCFPRGRIKYNNPQGIQGAPLQGQMFAYFGPSVEIFIQQFKKHGVCLTTTAM